MEQSSAKTADVFRRIGFFSDEFPFSIHREFDRPGDFNESRRFRREFWKIVCVVDGRGEYLIGEERHPLGPGSIFLVHPDDPTTFRIESEALEIYNILFMPELLRDGPNTLAVSAHTLPGVYNTARLTLRSLGLAGGQAAKLGMQEPPAPLSAADMPRRCPRCGGAWAKTEDEDITCINCGEFVVLVRGTFRDRRRRG